RSYDTSIAGVSLVVTVYNAVLAATAFVLVRIRRWSPERVARVGLVAFTAASLVCAAAPNVAVLVGARAAQGAAGAALLVGTIAVLRSLAPTRALALAGTAGAIGAAVGPAAGGFLTQCLDWRAIFAFQAPVAGAALLGVRRAAWPTDARSSFRANVSLALVSGGLVGALFLVVVLLIDVWGLSPATAAVV